MINKGIKTRDEIFIEKGLNPEDVSNYAFPETLHRCFISWFKIIDYPFSKFKVTKDEIVEDEREAHLDALADATLEDLDQLEASIANRMLAICNGDLCWNTFYDL